MSEHHASQISTSQISASRIKASEADSLHSSSVLYRQQAAICAAFQPPSFDRESPQHFFPSPESHSPLDSESLQHLSGDELSTGIVHAIPADPLTGALSVPIYQTSTYAQEAPGVHQGFDYARTANPTRAVLERLLARLEGGSAAYAFSSGLAAIDAVLKLLSSGDEVLAVDDVYGGSFRLFEHVYSRFGVRVRYVDTSNPANVEAAWNERVKAVWLESPTNPTLKISDIKKIAGLAHAHGAVLVVDNTFASPAAQRPLSLGADIVVHSVTKYLAGHADLIGGAVTAASPEIAERIRFIQNASGAILGPFDSWLTIRGLETLVLRVRQQCETAHELAERLLEHPAVERVYYPGLPSHPNHEIAAKQQNGLFGGVVALALRGDEQFTREFVSTRRYFRLAESLGGVKSLICHPATMTHRTIPRERRLAAGVSDTLVRLSVGIESVDELWEDLERGLCGAELRHVCPEIGAVA